MKSEYPKFVFPPLSPVGAQVHSRTEEWGFILAPVAAALLIAAGFAGCGFWYMGLFS